MYALFFGLVILLNTTLYMLVVGLYKSTYYKI